uniref:Uncharacterized protein n=1 Tax=Podarcis muralis TaxID=64176 RepID=A0A670HZP4_PODMU
MTQKRVALVNQTMLRIICLSNMFTNLRDLNNTSTCPICMEYLTDPVTLACGHNFCRDCIVKYCDTWEPMQVGDLECPVCKAQIQRGSFRPNWQLANIVEKIKLLPPNKGGKDLINFQDTNVTLDPDTAHPRLILSEDRKSVRYGAKLQDLPDNPERFSDMPCVLGCEGFTAGRHFWEVTMESGEWWALGVARKSVRRKGNLTFFWSRLYFAFTSPDSSPLSLSEEPKRIRVTLDYEVGRVSFSDADSGAELHTFSGASFSRETLLPFFYLGGNETHLSIS